MTLLSLPRLDWPGPHIGFFCALRAGSASHVPSPPGSRSRSLPARDSSRPTAGGSGGETRKLDSPGAERGKCCGAGASRCPERALLRGSRLIDSGLKNLCVELGAASCQIRVNHADKRRPTLPRRRGEDGCPLTFRPPRRVEATVRPSLQAGVAGSSFSSRPPSAIPKDSTGGQHEIAGLAPIACAATHG